MLCSCWYATKQNYKRLLLHDRLANGRDHYWCDSGGYMDIQYSAVHQVILKLRNPQNCFIWGYEFNLTRSRGECNLSPQPFLSKMGSSLWKEKKHIEMTPS